MNTSSDKPSQTSKERHATAAGLTRRSVLTSGVVAGATALGLSTGLVTPALASASSTRAARRGSLADPGASPRVDFNRWTTFPDFRSGHSDGVIPLPGSRLGVVLGTPAGTTTYTDPYLKTTRTYEYGTWLSPRHDLDFGATELVSSWDALTPVGTFLKVEMLATMEDGHQDVWTMGIWAFDDSEINRTSVNGQQNEYGEVDTDTFVADNGHTLRSYQLRLTLYRQPGVRESPRVWQIGAMTSAIPARTTVPASTPGPATGIQLPVPAYAQNPHANEYPQYGGGGEAWCSPTSSAMVVNFWGLGPTKQQMSWINPSYQDPVVDYAARYCYDYGYQGTGNWPFNAAYAASYGLDGMVTRLNSLTELEVLIAAGIPVITSQAFTAAEMGYSTQGHLWVVIGFTDTGDVIVNDPASNSDANVYTIYNRREFEIVWLRTVYTQDNGQPGSGSGGVVYLDKPHDRVLPPVLDPRNPSWPSGQA